MGIEIVSCLSDPDVRVFNAYLETIKERVEEIVLLAKIEKELDYTFFVYEDHLDIVPKIKTEK